MKKSFKNLAIALLTVTSILFLSSCNRGGYGCPYELKAPASLIHIIK